MPFEKKKYQKQMSNEEYFQYRNDHDGFQRAKMMDNPILEPMLDQGQQMTEFYSVKEMNENYKFQETERKITKVS